MISVSPSLRAPSFFTLLFHLFCLIITLSLSLSPDNIDLAGTRWTQWTFTLEPKSLSALAETPVIELQSTCDVVLHMVELLRGGVISDAGRAMCKGPSGRLT